MSQPMPVKQGEEEMKSCPMTAMVRRQPHTTVARSLRAVFMAPDDMLGQ